MTQGLNARRAAIMALGFTLKSRTALDTALAQTPDFEKMEARDRAFARLISATTLRRRGQIRGVLRKFMQRALPDPDGEAQLILETAVAQILFLDTKPHAAVSAAVTLARGNRSNERYAGMINAVVDEGELEAATRNAAGGLAAKPPEALTIARRLLRGDNAEILKRIDDEAAHFAERLASQEARAAFTAFMNKGKA